MNENEQQRLFDPTQSQSEGVSGGPGAYRNESTYAPSAAVESGITSPLQEETSVPSEQPVAECVFRSAEPSVSEQAECSPAPAVSLEQTGGPQEASVATAPKLHLWPKILVCALVSALLGSMVTAGGFMAYQEYRGQTLFSKQPSLTQQLQAQTTTPSSDNSEEAGLTPQQIAEKAGAAVVAIRTTAVQQSLFGEQGLVEGAGSGVLVSQDGYIVTNNHVINGSKTIQVHLPSGEEKDAQVVGQDPTTDLAVIKIAGTSYPYLELGDSDQVRMGEQVVAIGNPLGEYEGSLTVGYISATNRTVRVQEEGNTQTLYGLLQTDAAINRGNSGGALINRKGALIGINSVKTSAVGVEGIGFAIPSNTIRPIIQDLIQHGSVQDRPYLGLAGVTMRSEWMQEFGYPAGVFIRSVVAGGPADQAGIRQGDIITEIDGKAVAAIEDINGMKPSMKIGQEIQVTLFRAGKTEKVRLVLQRQPQTPAG